MDSLLSLNGLLERIEKYTVLRSNALDVDEKGAVSEPLHPRASLVLREAAIAGEITRGKVFEIIGMSDSGGKKLLKGWLDEGLLVPSRESHRSSVRLGFPAHTAAYWFRGYSRMLAVKLLKEPTKRIDGNPDRMLDLTSWIILRKSLHPSRSKIMERKNQ